MELEGGWDHKGAKVMESEIVLKKLVLLPIYLGNGHRRRSLCGAGYSFVLYFHLLSEK